MSVLPVGFGSALGGYNIERSLRFNSADSAYLNRTPASTSNQKKWTWSGWVKRGVLSTYGGLMSGYVDANNYTTLYFWNDNTITFYQTIGGSAGGQIATSAVFRDPSAWYHIVIVYDSANATQANRVLIYVNGVQQTLTTTTAITLNTNSLFNVTTATQNLGRHGAGSNYFNGYLTEVNFIDGQVPTTTTRTVNGITETILTQLGEFDSATGVWIPKAYTGTYGTNGFYLPFKTASQWSGYFDGTGDYASFSPTSALNAGTGNFTLEFWTYHLTSSTYQGYYYGGAVGSINFRRTSSNTIELAHDGITSVLITSTTIPANQWVHVAVTRNSGTVRIFINGVSGGSVTYTGNFNSTGGTGTIGSITSSIYNLNGYISNLRLITGTALYTANFTPPTAQLTAVSGTQLLTCQSSTFVDNSTNAFTITAAGDARPQQFSPFTLDVTDDHSGTGNHWIPNNLDLRTTGAGADILVDTPTSYGTDTGVGGEVRGNYATANPLWEGASVTLANGNLDVSATSVGSRQGVIASIFVSSGKWYFEYIQNADSNSNLTVGIADTSFNATNSYVGQTATTYGYTARSNTKYNNNTGTSYGTGSSTNGDVLMCAFDLDNGKIYFGKNGTWYGSGDPVAGTNAAFTGISGTYCPAYGHNATASQSTGITFNFGQRAFAYTAPSGFKALCTQNLPTPTIGATSTTQANDYFDVVTRNGNNSSYTVSGLGFTPDFFWTKCRNTALSHYLADSVRGNDQVLFSNLTNIEFTEADYITATSSNGYTLGAGANVANYNGTGGTYVDWLWNAGGSNQTISVGQYATSPANVPSIASTVRANTTSGFSIVTFTTNNTAGATVGHGCQVGGVATTPDMIIMKYRGLAANWVVYHKSMNATPQNGYLNLNTSAPYAPLIDPWNNTAPSSTVITMGAGAGSAGSTNYGVYTSVAYCFAAVPGYSAFGSYAGNGTTTSDGPFIYTGFRPAFVMLKAYIGSGENWTIYDKSRIGYNSSNYVLFPNLPNIENAATTHIDLLSNGFKLRSNNNNLSSYSYIYAAFAEHPFKYSLAR